MQEIDFYALPRSVQDRLLSSFGYEYEPKPVMFSPGVRPIGVAWLAVTPVAVSALAALCWVGIGDVDSGLARQSFALIGVYVGLSALAALGVAQWLAYRARIAVVPYLKGVYLMPANLIDAREAMLRVLPVDDISKVVGRGSKVTIKIGSRSYTFPVEPAHVERAVDIVQQAKGRAPAQLPEAQRRELDPLVPPAVVSPLASDVPLTASYPRWLKMRWVAVAVVAMFGLAIYLVRDRVSDDRMFASAKARDDVAGFEAYLARGDRHREVVSRELLPRAELRNAAAVGSVEAIDAFRERFPDTAIGDEIERARKVALSAAFERARDKGTLLALLEYAERYPKHHLAKHYEAAKHAIYAKVLAEYQTKAPDKASAKVAAFGNALLSYAEKVGPSKKGDAVVGVSVQLRMRRVPSKAMDKSDELVKLSTYYAGEPSLPSTHFDGPHLDALDKRFSTGLLAAFSKEFPPEVLTFESGDLIDGDIPDVTQPTLVVSYRIEPSGANYASRKPRGIFVGLGFFFQMDFLLPGEKPLKLNHIVEARIPVKMLLEHEPGGERVEETVYRRMAERAFDEGMKRYLGQWFKQAG